MSTKTLFKSLAIGAGFLLMAAAAQAAAQSIAFPIAELGGCAGQASCHAFCDQEANHAACEAFAQAHGLASVPGASSMQSNGGASAALAAIEQDGGPGLCGKDAKDPANACRTYCDETSHIQECVAYGKVHGLFTGNDLQEAQKVAAALQNGAALPTGCTDAASCKQVCGNPKSVDQATSCFSFAQAAGLLPPGFDGSGAEKVFDAIRNATSSPFKTPKDFAKCADATASSTLKECTDFAVHAGLMTPLEAQTLQQTGGMGPGGCQGKDACDAYCSAHEEECFAFAKEHGLVGPEERQHLQEGAAHLQEALSQAPDAVKQCITNTIGQDALASMLSGDTPPGREFAAAAQNCFGQMVQEQGDDHRGFLKSFGSHDSSSTPIGDDMRGSNKGKGMPGGQFPPQVAYCLAGKIGTSTVATLEQQPGSLSDDIAEAVRECYSENLGENAPPPPESTRMPPPAAASTTAGHRENGTQKANGPANAHRESPPTFDYPHDAAPFPTAAPERTPPPPRPSAAPLPAATSGLTSFLNALNPATIVANVLWAVREMH